MATPSINALFQALREVIHRPVNHVLENFFSTPPPNFSSSLDRLVGFCACFVLQDAPDAVVHHVQIGRIRRPFAIVSLGTDVDVDDLWEDVLDQVPGGDGLVG